MNVQEMKDVLRRKYGINDIEDLERAIAEAPGVDIGIFTKAIPGKENKNDGDEVCTV